MLKEKLAKLIELKSIMSISATVVFTILSLRGVLSTEVIMGVIMLIFSHFFAYQNNKNVNK